ncbi:sterol desaturase family protein [Polaromonas sp.]|uniref:sterol desaturase family protein n=1 Tax=Polaromonas sp. TaxID=1869339 RepID=UPI002FC9A5A5
MQQACKYLYAPSFFFGFIGLAAWLVSAQQMAPWLLIPLFLAAVSTSFAAEAWLAYDPAWNRACGDSHRDVAHGLVNETLNALGICVVPAIASLMPFAGLWPDRWPFGLQLLMAIVVADIGLTLAHYLSHRVSLLWRLHAVHHSVQRMYGFNGLMKHPLHQAIEAAAGISPLLLVGMPVSVAAVLAFAISIQLLLQHANVDMQLGPLCKVFAWAPLHRFHHMKYGAAGDVNFGLFFNLWDRLLGTNFDARNYSMTSHDLGIGSRPDYPGRYLAQIIEPFKPENTVPSPPAPPELIRH